VLNAARPSAALPKIGTPTVHQSESALTPPPNGTSFIKRLMVTGSNQETADEVTGCQTIDRYRQSQDQRES
jgi:hypothetical protein